METKVGVSNIQSNDYEAKDSRFIIPRHINIKHVWIFFMAHTKRNALWGILLYSILVCEVGSRLNSLSVSFPRKLG